jgi:hypothetical protein
VRRALSGNKTELQAMRPDGIDQRRSLADQKRTPAMYHHYRNFIGLHYSALLSTKKKSNSRRRPAALYLAAFGTRQSHQLALGPIGTATVSRRRDLFPHRGASG